MRHIFLIAALAAGTALVSTPVFAQAPAAARPADPFPAGEGHDLVAVACTQCHLAAPIAALRMDEKGWRQQIQIMIVRGAQIGPNQIDQAAGYLASVFGPGVPLPYPTKKDVHLATGAGLDLVEQNCSLCHGLDRIVAANRPGKQWQAVVHRMGEIGASLDADQQKQIVAYLETNYAGAKK